MIMGTQEHSLGLASSDTAKKMIVFTLDDQRYGLGLASVERITRIVEIVQLPKKPEIVLGVINVGGEIIPVMNVRRRFQLPERELDLRDHLIIARASRRRVALAVDAVLGVVEASESNTTLGGKISPGLDYVEGVVKLDDGLILIHNLGTFLSPEEEKTLEEAMTLK